MKCEVGRYGDKEAKSLGTTIYSFSSLRHSASRQVTQKHVLACMCSHVCARTIGVRSHVLFECLVNAQPATVPLLNAQPATVPLLPYSLATSSEGGVHVHQ